MSLRRLAQEMDDILDNEVDGIQASPHDESVDMFTWDANIIGPDGSPYENGVFFLSMVFPKDYPTHPPAVRFITKIYHMNINGDGEFCHPLIKDEWKASTTIIDILIALRNMLKDPLFSTPIMPNIAIQYRDDRTAHDKEALRQCILYAQ